MPLPVPFIAPGLEPVALTQYEVIVRVSPMVIDEVIVAVPDPDANKAEADIGVKMPDRTMLSAVVNDELMVVLDGVTKEDPVIKGAGVIFVLLVEAPLTKAGWLGEWYRFEATDASAESPVSAFRRVLETCGLSDDALLASIDEEKDKIDEEESRLSEIDATGATHFVHTVEVDVLRIVETLVVTCRIGVPLSGVMVLVTGQVVRVV